MYALEAALRHDRFKHQLPVAENLLKRQFTATGPNRECEADITYIPTNEGLAVFGREQGFLYV